MWSSSMETCNARRVGRHWRQSLYKKKGKSHGSSQHKYKHKTRPPLPPAGSVKSPPPAVPPPPLPPPAVGPIQEDEPNVFHVLDFGAKGDGSTDDTKAFQAAWAAACKVEASVINVPAEYVFLVGPISFSGPYCQHNIVFQLDGTIIAPKSSGPWGSGLLQWLEFSKLVGLTIKGSGLIDGNGAVWWQSSPFDDDPFDDQAKFIVPLNATTTQKPPMPIESSLGGKMPSIKPTALRFYGSFNVTVTGITIQNSAQCHLKFDNCIGVSVYNFTVSSPGNSPNTDGIHLQNSKDVLIRSSNLACGDDCVSIQTGCTNVYVHNINCGPGHGISIGGLGKDDTKACVSNITVRDVIMHNTMNGVRIKTWQGGSGSVRGVLFSNIQVSEVQLPIVIDQYYCDKTKCKNQTTAVSLSGINYENIRGTYTVKPLHFACSDNVPCTDVTLTNIKLTPQQEGYHMYNDPFCWQTFGQLFTPTLPPVMCLQIGKPSSNKILGDHDSC
ncbi:Pectin lyase-like superfamily protein [Striga hermonthica]|uniref:Pectin lyase-like superfamily protein n=1 Tax=Striga hermonthica TaxID=68872 RepID=A0A9N7NMK4_STRHE|nr:Pectin lyase-like superfamily protein [Striga hermonthica]